jgi:hypothetical protein
MDITTAQQLMSLAAAQSALRTNSGVLYVPALQQARQTVETVQQGGNPQGQEIVSGPPSSVDLKA